MSKKVLRDGFTLVELSFSLLFIGILSIIIVLIINNTVVAYRRGLLLGQINSNGMELVDDMRAAIQNSSSAWSLKKACYSAYDESNLQARCEHDDGWHLAFVEKVAYVTVNGVSKLRRIYGAFCTGEYSYIWNSGYFKYEKASFEEKESGWAKLKYKMANAENSVTIGNEEPFRLLKVEDGSWAVCRAAMGGGYVDDEFMSGYGFHQHPSDITNEIDISSIDIRSEPEELLAGDNSNTLAFYDLSIPLPAEDENNKNMFYYGSFVLGTITNGADVTVKGDNACVSQDSEEEGRTEYCGINQFIFTAQVNGG